MVNNIVIKINKNYKNYKKIKKHPKYIFLVSDFFNIDKIIMLIKYNI